MWLNLFKINGCIWNTQEKKMIWLTQFWSKLLNQIVSSLANLHFHIECFALRCGDSGFLLGKTATEEDGEGSAALEIVPEASLHPTPTSVTRENFPPSVRPWVACPLWGCLRDYSSMTAVAEPVFTWVVKQGITGTALDQHRPTRQPLATCGCWALKRQLDPTALTEMGCVV